MKVIVSSLTAALLLAAASTAAGAASNGHDRAAVNGNGQSGDCVVTGWTDWSLTRPIFKCPEASETTKVRRRR
jgi:hypothetical protein